jgi:acylphosphatase
VPAPISAGNKDFRQDGKAGMANSEGRQRRTLYYQGRVQGVGFRWTVQHIASSYPVTGYVQNLEDGRVLLVVEGATGQLDPFLHDVDQKLGRYIAAVQKSVQPATGEFDDFHIRR